MTTYTFFITSLIIILLPGTGVIYTISVGILNGKKASVLAAFSCTLGILPHLCTSIALSTLLLQMNPKVFTIIKLTGALYLLYLGCKMMFSKENLEFQPAKKDIAPLTILQQGILINLLNPKLTLFFFSFLPQYIRGNKNNFAFQSFLLGVAFMLLTLIIFIGYGILAGTAKKFIIASPKRMAMLQKCFAIIFVLFAVKLALTPF